MITASQGNQPFTMGVHDHEHPALAVGYDFSVVTGSVKDCVRIVRFKDRDGLGPFSVQPV